MPPVPEHRAGYEKVFAEIKKRERYLPLRSLNIIPPTEFDDIFSSSDVSSLENNLTKTSTSNETLSCILMFVLNKQYVPAERESLLNAIKHNEEPAQREKMDVTLAGPSLPPEVGDKMTILCTSKVSVKGVTWKKDGTEIRMEGRYEGATVRSPSLTVAEVRKSDMGSYTCVITDKDDKKHERSITINNVLDKGTLKNLMKGYWPLARNKEIDSEVAKALECIRSLKEKCIELSQKGIEIGGFFLGKDWTVPCIFGTQNMTQVLQQERLVHYCEEDKIFRIVASDDSPPSEDSELENLKEKADELHECGFTVWMMEVSQDREKRFCMCKLGNGNQKGTESQPEMLKMPETVHEKIKEMDRKPLSISEIITVLTKQSVGLLYWKNHCQATVTCVGENLVLTPAHVFDLGDDDLFDHLLYDISTTGTGRASIPDYTLLRHKRIQYNITDLTDLKHLLENMKMQYEQGDHSADSSDESECESFEMILKDHNFITDKNVQHYIVLTDKLIHMRKTRRKQFEKGDIKIHPGYVQEAEVLDHKDKNCCGYTVDEVVFINFDLDVAILKISKEADLPSIPRMTPMLLFTPIDSEEEENREMPTVKGQDHCHIAAHPLHKSLSVEKFVKLLDEKETEKFVEKFICHASIESVQRNCSGLLYYVPTPRLPMMILRSVLKADQVHTCCARSKCFCVEVKSYDEQDYHSLSNKEKCMYYAKEKDEPPKPISFGNDATSSNLNGGGDVTDHTKKLVLNFDSIEEEFSESLDRYMLPPEKTIKSTSLQIPIPKVGNPYRFIVTEKEKQASIAIEISDNNIRATSVQKKIIVEERMRPIVLSVSERKIYKCHYMGQTKHPLWIAEKQQLKQRGCFFLDPPTKFVKGEIKGQIYTLGGKESCDVSKNNFSISLKKNKKGRHCLHYFVKNSEEGDTNSSTSSQKDPEGKEEIIYFGVEEKTKYPLEKDDFEVKDGEWKQLKPETEQSQDSDSMINEKTKKSEKCCIEISCDKERDNVIVIRRKDVKKEYIKMEVRWNETEEALEMKTQTTEKPNSRKIYLNDYEYLVWQVEKLPKTLELLFFEKEKNKKSKGKTHVKVKLISSICQEHTEVHFEPSDNKACEHFLRKQSIEGKRHELPVRSFIIDHKLHGKPSSREHSKRYVHHLHRWLSNEDCKKSILDEREWKEAYLQYRYQSNRFQYMKLIDMEHGASGGPCFEFCSRKPLLKGILLGACPRFYYNDENLRLFFQKGGTCFNRILPVGQLKKEIKDSDTKIEIKDLPEIPGTWELQMKISQ